MPDDAKSHIAVSDPNADVPTARLLSAESSRIGNPRQPYVEWVSLSKLDRTDVYLDIYWPR